MTTTTKSRKGGRTTAKKEAPAPVDRVATYKRIADTLIDLSLREGKLFWHKDWTELGLGGAGITAMPRSVATHKLSRGINTWILTAAIIEHGWQSLLFATYEEWMRLGGAVEVSPKKWRRPDGQDVGVKAGEHGTKIVFWSKVPRKTGQIDPVTGQEEKKMFFILREFTVYEVEGLYRILKEDGTWTFQRRNAVPGTWRDVQGGFKTLAKAQSWVSTNYHTYSGTTLR